MMNINKKLDEVFEYLKENKVLCKKVRPEYGEAYIAIFGYGELTRTEIANKIKENNLQCMFFERCIREDEDKKRSIKAN